MSAVSFVKALVFRQGAMFYDNNPVTRQIPCEGSEVGPVEYWNPVVSNGVLVGYAPTQDSTLATTDSIKTVRVHNALSNTTYWIVVANSGGVATFTDNCNACCGATPDMTTGITIPAPIIEETIKLDSAGVEQPLLWGVPSNPFGRNILIPRISYNSGTVPFAPTAGGYANVAAVVSALNTGASAMGTWSAINSSKTIKLVPSAGLHNAGLELAIKESVFCLTLPSTPATIGLLRLTNASNVAYNYDIPDITLSVANRTAVLAALKQQLTGTVELVDMGSSDWRVRYTGQQKPVSLLSPDGTTTTVAFTAGACA